MMKTEIALRYGTCFLVNVPCVKYIFGSCWLARTLMTTQGLLGCARRCWSQRAQCHLKFTTITNLCWTQMMKAIVAVQSVHYHWTVQMSTEVGNHICIVRCYSNYHCTLNTKIYGSGGKYSGWLNWYDAKLCKVEHVCHRRGQTISTSIRPLPCLLLAFK